MEYVDPLRIADILETSPIVARLGLTAQNDRLRRRAAEALGAMVARQLGDADVVDDRQMILPIEGGTAWA
jgi:hypothetical protein